MDLQCMVRQICGRNSVGGFSGITRNFVVCFSHYTVARFGVQQTTPKKGVMQLTLCESEFEAALQETGNDTGAGISFQDTLHNIFIFGMAYHGTCSAKTSL